MKKLFLINAFLEGFAGLYLLLRPDHLLFAESPTPDGFAVSRLYGIAALFLGLISYHLWKHYQDNEMFRMIVLMLALFHMAVGFHFYGVYQAGLTPHIGATVTHILVSIFFLFTYMNNKNEAAVD